jgi:hypothetical protein
VIIPQRLGDAAPRGRLELIETVPSVQLAFVL